MNDAELAELRNRSIGFVFQSHFLLPEFTALENVAMPALVRRGDRTKAYRRARALLERMGLGDRVDHRPGELSGGESQRVALARALVLEPTLLLADEPTGNLDPATGEGIHALLREVNRELGITAIVVTHNEELARSMPRQLRLTGRQGHPRGVRSRSSVSPGGGRTWPDRGSRRCRGCSRRTRRRRRSSSPRCGTSGRGGTSTSSASRSSTARSR